MSLFSLIKRAPKRLSAAVVMIATAIIIPTAAFAWGPSRETFTLAHPSDHVQFNSIVDATNPNLTDERNFVGIREVGSANVWYDDITAQPGKEYLVRMYVHNNAASNLNLVAENVTAKFNLPTTTAKSIQVNGFLSASNVGAKAGVAGSYAEVYDHATFNSTENFNLAYTANSLKYENNAFGATGTPLSESIFTSTGAKLGYDQLNGRIPGCFQYAGYVTFKVKPQFATPTQDFTIQKEVRKNGDKTFVESVETKAGDTLNYRIIYKNTGSAQANNVILKDTLPAGISYVPGTVMILNANNLSGSYIQDGDKLFSTGANIGAYTSGSNAIVIFNATVDEDVNLELCGTNTLRNIASAQPQGQTPKEDGANVTIPKECQPEECKPGIPVGDARCNPPAECLPGVPVGDAKCDTPELPHTGAKENIVAFLGLGALIAGIVYYVASRRALNQ